MRLSALSVVPWGVLASLALLAGPARAHISLKSPTPRTDQLKQGPCGAGANDPRGPTVATFKPGETITVTWNEFVDHPGHYRIAFDEDGQDGFFDPASFDDVSGGPGVLIDGIFDQNGGDYSLEVTLPDVECDNCVLQVIQVMTDKKPYGDGNDLYYQCADIALVAEGVDTTGEPGSTGTTDATTGDTSTTGASAGDSSTGEEPGSTGGGETAGPETTGEGQTTGSVTGANPTTTAGATTTATTGGATDSSTGDAGTDGADEDAGCGCRGDGETGGAGWLALGLLPLVRRRRRA